MVPPRLRGPALAVGVAALALALTAVPGPLGSVAHAETSTDARARAAALATQVVDLRHRTESAVEAYDSAAGTLQTAVSTQVQDQAAADAAVRAAAVPDQAAAAQVRSLYEQGGPLVSYAALLRAGDPGDLVTNVQGARRQAQASEAVTDSAAAAESLAAARLRSATAAAQQVSDLTARAQTRADQVTALLGRQTALLSAADARVRTLEAQEEQARLLQAQLAFLAKWRAARLDAAENAHLIGLPGMGTEPGMTDLSLATAGNGDLLALMEQARDPQVVAAITAQAQQAADPVAAAALVASLGDLGAPYLWGGTGPTRFDCSGLTGAAYAAAGLVLPRTAAQQWLAGPHPSLADLRPGDLLFWADDVHDPATIHHVALYAGGNLMVSTDHTGDVARVQPIWADGFIGATRPDPALAGQVAGPIWAPGQT